MHLSRLFVPVDLVSKNLTNPWELLPGFSLLFNSGFPSQTP